jgi:hypothetical protein
VRTTVGPVAAEFLGWRAEGDLAEHTGDRAGISSPRLTGSLHEMRLALRYTLKTEINVELAHLAVRTWCSVKFERVCDLRCPAIRTGRNRSQRIDHELAPAGQADVRRVNADAPGQSLVVRVMSVLLGAVAVEVVRVAVGPRLNGLAAVSTDESYAFCHRSILRRSVPAIAVRSRYRSSPIDV